MAFAATNVKAEPRAISVGPWKIQAMNYSVASGDTSGTATFDSLSSIDFVIVEGVCGVGTAAPTFSGNVVTLAFVNPAATRYGQILAFGK